MRVKELVDALSKFDEQMEIVCVYFDERDDVCAGSLNESTNVVYFDEFGAVRDDFWFDIGDIGFTCTNSGKVVALFEKEPWAKLSLIK